MLVVTIVNLIKNMFVLTKRFIKYVLLLLLLMLQTIRATEYCRLCKKGSHTLCRYKEGPSDNCIDYKKPEFSTSVKKYIVDIHNDIRNHIASGQETRGALGRQPAASNMNSLQWDSELADIAQRWADQCVGLYEETQHDQCRKTDRFEVGQNVLTAITPSLDVPEIGILILNWYKQVENVLPSDVETFSGIQRGKFLIGQYTQLVWADTRFVGCGMSTFRNKNNTDDVKAKYLHRLVCNYGTRGNVIGAPVYNRGVPCSKCIYGKCDPVRTSLCQGLEEPYTLLKKYDDKSKPSSEENATLHVHMPVSLFHTLSLGYILKHNLTEVIINNILQKSNVYLVHGDEIIDENGDKYVSSSINTSDMNVSQILNQLALAMHRMHPSAVDSDLLRNALRKTSNVLYHYNTFDKVLNTQIYNLENDGHIIVSDCKADMHRCQYEADEMPTKEPPIGDIVLPNNMVYRNIKGVWFHGKCRCNYVYRSVSSSVKYLSALLVTVSILCHLVI